MPKFMLTEACESAMAREGWSIFDADGELRLMRIDDTEELAAQLGEPVTEFESDDQAFTHVMQKAIEGSKLHAFALYLDGRSVEEVGRCEMPACFREFVQLVPELSETPMDTQERLGRVINKLQDYFRTVWCGMEGLQEVIDNLNIIWQEQSLPSQLMPNMKARMTELEDLLTSARCIAQRKGADTAWERFDARIASYGIGSVTARVFKVLPSDLEEQDAS